MDHKVSKDMISSGMIPSGEKTQADLGRTQYGSAPSPSSLMDAYKSIYEHHQKDADGKVIEHDEKEELNEGKMPEGLKNYLMKKKGKKEDKKEIKEVAITAGLLAKSALTGAASQLGAQTMSGITNNTGVKKKPTNSNISAKSNVNAGADLFDIVKGKLLDEGLSEEEIRDVMLTLTPDEILKEMYAQPGDKPMQINVADAKAKTPAYRNYMSGMKGKVTGKPLYEPSQDMKDRARGLK